MHYLSSELLKEKVKNYSYGQKKKLALVDILEPKYLFMDEITNGLDYSMLRELKKSIRTWSDGMTVLLTGHQLGFYNDFVDKLYIIKDMRIRLVEDDFTQRNMLLEDIYDQEIH